MQTPNYRADIDGLRALAVLAVMFFHVGFEAFPGGYVGVDVFFVISGFLITRLIRDEVLRTGSFRFSNFYLRRARRLLPALFFTFAASFAWAFVLFSPHDLQRFGGALVHAVGSLSNFFFWSESGYFDAEAAVKPLLHTWSLSVEEQFYLIWPALLVLLLTKAPRYVLPLALIVGGVGSLLLNLEFADGEIPALATMSPLGAGWFSDGPSTIFYLAPFRAFEFAIGAACVWLVEHPPGKRAVAELLAVAGLAMIAFAMLTYSEETLFPSVFALPPCIGTALLIWASTAKSCRGLLGSRILVGLGLISYSLYLIHWPLIVFYRYYTKSELGTLEQWAICGISVLLAAMMYRWIETPFRRTSNPADRLTPAGFGLACAMFALFVSLGAANSWANRGWPWRFGESDAIRAFGQIDELRRRRGLFLRSELTAYFEVRHDNTKILVVGDSLGGDLVVGLAQNLDDGYDIQLERYRRQCHHGFSGDTDAMSPECREALSALEVSAKIPYADEIYISFRPSKRFSPEEFIPLVEFLRKRAKPGARFVLFGRGPEFEGFHSTAVSMLGNGESIERVEAKAREVAEDNALLDLQMEKAAQQAGIEFVSKYDMLCEKERCRYFTDEGSLMFWDRNHLTVAGAKWYGARVVERVVRAPGRSDVRERRVRAVPESPPPRFAPPVELSQGEANSILEEYGAALRAAKLDGNSVFDSDRLPHPKARIRAAILMALAGSREPARRTFLTVSGRSLAFFQPGVGGARVPLDELSEEGVRWREIVRAEMMVLESALAR